MYVPEHFIEDDQESLCRLIRQNPLATLVVNGKDGLLANHIPLFVQADEQKGLFLQGHIARANSLWKEADEATVLAIFHGPQAYISPNWYPSKKEHGKVVPTWNYQVVHAHGTVSFIHDEQWKLAFLNKLTNQQESAQQTPWTVADAPERYTRGMLRAIVGFEIEVSEWVGKFKTSQNKSLEDRQGIGTGLAAAQESDLLSGL